MMTSCQQIVALSSFFQFIANVELSESWIPEAQSIKLTFLLILISNLLSYKI